MEKMTTGGNYDKSAMSPCVTKHKDLAALGLVMLGFWQALKVLLQR
jgi:hypothetical protein